MRYIASYTSVFMHDLVLRERRGSILAKLGSERFPVILNSFVQTAQKAKYTAYFCSYQPVLESPFSVRIRREAR